MWIEAFNFLNLIFTSLSLVESCVVLAIAYNTRAHLLPEGPESVRRYLVTAVRRKFQRVSAAKKERRMAGHKRNDTRGGDPLSESPSSASRFQPEPESVAAAAVRKKREAMIENRRSGCSGSNHTFRAQLSGAASRSSAADRSNMADSPSFGAKPSASSVKQVEDIESAAASKDQSDMERDQARFYTKQIAEGKRSTMLGADVTDETARQGTFCKALCLRGF